MSRVDEPIPADPPVASRVTGALAALACAACCALPVLVAAGILTGAGAAIAEQTLLAVAVTLAATALGIWWLRRRHRARRHRASLAAVAADTRVHTGCDGGCSC